MRICRIIILLLPFSGHLMAQVHSGKMMVEEMLLDMEDRYQVRFSYSKDIVPYDEMVAVGFERKSLVEVLEELGSQTGIIYRRRGSRVVLNYDPERKREMEEARVVLINNPIVDSLDEKTVPREEELVSLPDDVAVPRDTMTRFALLSRSEAKELVRSEQRYYEAEALRLDVDEEVQLMQVSLLPLRSILDRKRSKINHFSFNIVAGYTGGLQGFEIGGVANAVKRDMLGVQIAGATNYIGGNVEGIQLAGFTNFNQGIMRGIQVGGLGNINVQSDAIQIAGAFNLNRRISRGYQLAGLFNAGRNVTGGQLSGFFNLSLGNVYFQGSGFCNVAEDVDVQVAGLVNVAKNVDVLQLGLINVADSVSGVSFGLLNLIKKGYNKIEISTGDALYGNLAVKLGTRNFYNIFQVGTNFKKNVLGNGIIWGYGYGFGFFQKISEGFKFNPELLVSNIQEKRIIKPDLNLLNQVKFLFHFTEDKKMEIFAGPTFNFMISNLTSEEGELVGSEISNYTLFEKNIFESIEPVNYKFWIGFNAGIRL